MQEIDVCTVSTGDELLPISNMHGELISLTAGRLELIS